MLLVGAILRYSKLQHLTAISSKRKFNLQSSSSVWATCVVSGNNPIKVDVVKTIQSISIKPTARAIHSFDSSENLSRGLISSCTCFDTVKFSTIGSYVTTIYSAAYSNVTREINVRYVKGVGSTVDSEPRRRVWCDVIIMPQHRVCACKGIRARGIKLSYRTICKFSVNFRLSVVTIIMRVYSRCSTNSSSSQCSRSKTSNVTIRIKRHVLNDSSTRVVHAYLSRRISMANSYVTSTTTSKTSASSDSLVSSSTSFNAIKFSTVSSYITSIYSTSNRDTCGGSCKFGGAIIIKGRSASTYSTKVVTTCGTL